MNYHENIAFGKLLVMLTFSRYFSVNNRKISNWWENFCYLIGTYFPNIQIQDRLHTVPDEYGVWIDLTNMFWTCCRTKLNDIRSCIHSGICIGNAITLFSFLHMCERIINEFLLILAFGTIVDKVLFGTGRSKSFASDPIKNRFPSWALTFNSCRCWNQIHILHQYTQLRTNAIQLMMRITT